MFDPHFSAYLKNFDPFVAQKNSSFTSSLQQILSVANFLAGLSAAPDSPLEKIKMEFEHLVLVSSHIL